MESRLPEPLRQPGLSRRASLRRSAPTGLPALPGTLQPGVRDLAERLRRFQPCAVARLSPDGPHGDLDEDLRKTLTEMRRRTPSFFVAGPPSPEPRNPGPDAVLPADLWERATLDGSMRAFYGALRPYHLVTVGPAWLREIGDRFRCPSFHHEPVPPGDGASSRAAVLRRLEVGHRRFHGEPTVYLFHEHPATAAWIAELFGRLRGASFFDLGTALDACVPSRVRAANGDWVHWQRLSRHLGLETGGPWPETDARAAAPAEWRLLHPSEAPARAREERPMPPVERRRSPRNPASEANPVFGERSPETDLRRCIAEVISKPRSA